MNNWEHYFGTPERAALMCLEYCFEPMVLAVNRVEHINGRPVPVLVAWFNSFEEYTAWLKAEYEGGIVRNVNWGCLLAIAAIIAIDAAAIYAIRALVLGLMAMAVAAC